MLCLGIGNIRAKFTERKEEKHLPVAHCPPQACCFSIYFFLLLSSWLQFTQKEKGKKPKEKHGEQRAPHRCPAQAGWRRGAARARRCSRPRAFQLKHKCFVQIN